jgi:hypothetical protein
MLLLIIAVLVVVQVLHEALITIAADSYVLSLKIELARYVILYSIYKQSLCSR